MALWIRAPVPRTQKEHVGVSGAAQAEADFRFRVPVPPPHPRLRLTGREAHYTQKGKGTRSVTHRGGGSGVGRGGDTLCKVASRDRVLLRFAKTVGEGPSRSGRTVRSGLQPGGPRHRNPGPGAAPNGQQDAGPGQNRKTTTRSLGSDFSNVQHTRRRDTSLRGSCPPSDPR